MKRYLMLLLAVILLVPAGTAFAGPWGRGMGMGPGHGPGLYATANLSPEQSSQLQALREGHWKEIGPLQAAFFAKRSEMRMLWASPNRMPKRSRPYKRTCWISGGRFRKDGSNIIWSVKNS